MSTTYHLRCVRPGDYDSEHWGEFRSYAIPIVQALLDHRSAIEELQLHVEGFDIHITGIYQDGDVSLGDWLLAHSNCPIAIYDEYGREKVPPTSERMTLP